MTPDWIIFVFSYEIMNKNLWSGAQGKEADQNAAGYFSYSGIGYQINWYEVAN